MIILDSSVIISLFRREEKHHQDALSILNSGQEFLIFDFVLSEVLTVIKIREGHHVASKCTEFLVNNHDFIIKQLPFSDLKSTILFFKEKSNKLSFIDTLLFLYSRQHQIPLATFDHDLIKELKR